MKKFGPGVSEEKLFKGVNRRTDGWVVITIAHPEPSAQLKKKTKTVRCSKVLSFVLLFSIFFSFPRVFLVC